MGNHLLKARHREAPSEQCSYQKNSIRPHPICSVNLYGVDEDVFHKDRYFHYLLHIRDKFESALEVLLLSQDGDGDGASLCVQRRYASRAPSSPNWPLRRRRVLYLCDYREKIGFCYRTAQTPTGRRVAVYLVGTS